MTPTSHSHHRRGLIAGGVLGFPLGLLLLMAVASAGPEEGPTEYELKAAFLHKFVSYVEWPEKCFHAGSAPEQRPDARPSGEVFRIGVLGKDPFGAVLEDTVRGKRVKDRPVAIERSQSVEQLYACHLLFICASERDRLAEHLAALQDRPILTVGETAGFAALGGILNLFFEGRKLRFEVNPQAAERCGLQLSAKLLKLARVVRTETPVTR